MARHRTAGRVGRRHARDDSAGPGEQDHLRWRTADRDAHGGDGGCARDGGERAAGPAPEQTPFGAPERPRAAGPAPERRTAAGSGRTAASVRGRAVSERAFRTISPFRTNSPTARIAGLKYGFLGDAVNGFLDALEGGPTVVEINGYVVPILAGRSAHSRLRDSKALRPHVRGVRAGGEVRQALRHSRRGLTCDAEDEREPGQRAGPCAAQGDPASAA